MSTAEHTPEPWVYDSGAVWAKGGPDTGGVCVATRASAAPIPPTEKDANMRLCAGSPKALALAELIERTLGNYFDGKKTDTIQLHAILESAREYLAAVKS